MLTLVLPQVMSFCEVYLSVIYNYDKTFKKKFIFVCAGSSLL